MSRACQQWRNIYFQGDKVLDYRRFQVLKTLAEEGGWLTRWRLTRKALDHMTVEDRQAILDDLIGIKQIEQRRTRQPQGPGPTAVEYRLMPEGLKAYRKAENALENGASLEVCHQPRRSLERGKTSSRTA